MRICFLAPANSAHTKKWCHYFASKGHEVHVVSFCEEQIDGVQVHWVSTGASTEGNDVQKLLYLTKAGQVKRLVRHIDPDVINVHYATSYGAVAALAGLKNYALSVWGSDIYVFPRKSPIHRLFLQFSLSRAKYLFSTSHVMAQEAAKYTPKTFEITPYGVDLDLFTPQKRCRQEDGQFVVGTIKALTPTYGIDSLLQAVAVVREKEPQIPIRVKIAGKGSHEQEYRALAAQLKLDDITTWLGFIPQEQVAVQWANMDLAVVFSNQESFGVSAVEAQACGCPMIISDIPGLLESTNPGHSSLPVPCGDVQALARAILQLYHDPQRRARMGKAGRDFVMEQFELGRCFEKVESLFETFAAK